MKNRVLMSDGSYQTYVAPVSEKKSAPVAPLATAPNVLDEKDEPANIVDQDYTLLKMPKLKEIATGKKLVFGGNISKVNLIEMIAEYDGQKNGTTAVEETEGL